MSATGSVDLAKLTEAFPRHAIKQREAVRGGKKLDYLEGHTVIHRLNDATGNAWDFRVVRIDSSVVGKDRNEQEIVLLMATVELTIPGLGTRSHVGVQLMRAGGGEDLAKGAITDGLKKAATLFGVGLELYGPDYEAGEADAPAERHQRPQDATNWARLAYPPRPAAPSGGGPRSAPPAARPGDLAGKIDYASSLIRNNGLDEAAELKPFSVSDIGKLNDVLADRLIERLEKRVGAGGAAQLAGMAEVAEARDPARWRA